MTRKILHLDLDAFFCAVEEQRDPTLCGVAFAVGGQPDERGVVAASSYPARQYGIRSAMPMATAVRLCPDLIIIPQNRGVYSEASRKVMQVLRDLTPFVEKLSIDEAFLDVTMLPQEAVNIARTLQSAINDDLHLPCSLGVATNKLVAKIANNIGKAAAESGKPPNAIRVVPPGNEAAFLAPLSIRELWGVGPKTAERLAKLGIQTIGDIAQWPQDDLARRFGKHGVALARHARGIDKRPVETSVETKSISKEITFTNDVSDAKTLKRVLHELSDGVGRQTRQSGLAGTTIKIKLRWADFTTLTRQSTLDSPTNQDATIYQAAEQLLQNNWPPGKPVRLLGVGISGFSQALEQLGLWENYRHDGRDRRLQETLDDLRARFGTKAVKRGSQIRPSK